MLYNYLLVMDADMAAHSTLKGDDLCATVLRCYVRLPGHSARVNVGCFVCDTYAGCLRVSCSKL